jgi:hypothetical protein
MPETNQPMYGFHRGVVLMNSDPAQRGRIKVFMPTHARQLANKLNSIATDKSSSSEVKASATASAQWCLKHRGDKVLTESGVSSVDQAGESSKKIPEQHLSALCSVLDWVDQASPLMGSGTIARFDSVTNTATTSDAPYATNSQEHGVSQRYNELEQETVSPSAGQGDKKTTNAGAVDPNSFNRKAPAYVNSAKGMFSVPRVGAHVWLFFENGDSSRPVYFAYSYDDAAWNSIMVQNQKQPDINSPSSVLSENLPGGGAMFTGKTVFNEKGGVLEFINTDDFEAVRLADHKGSHINIDRHGVSLITARDRDMKVEVKGNYFVDVHGDYKVTVKGQKQLVMEGYEHRIHGNLKDAELQKRWIETANSHGVFSMAARRVAPINYKQQHDEIYKSAEKKAPNNTFCLPSLSFKLPPGVSMTKLIDNLNKVLKVVGNYLDMAKLYSDTLSEIVGDVLGLFRNPLDFLFAMLGDPIKLIGIKLCNKKKK